jgi:NADPH:quinone reductase-like Zn-dependent oxidoreductase
MEYCGRVAEIGADVSDLAVGDRVVGMANYGAFADELVTEQVYTRSL